MISITFILAFDLIYVVYHYSRATDNASQQARLKAGLRGVDIVDQSWHMCYVSLSLNHSLQFLKIF